MNLSLMKKHSAILKDTLISRLLPKSTSQSQTHWKLPKNTIWNGVFMRVEIGTALQESLINKLSAILIKTMMSGRNSEKIIGSRPKSTGILRDGKKAESINVLLLTTVNLLHNHTSVHPKVVIALVLEVLFSSPSSIFLQIRRILTLFKLNLIKQLIMLLSKQIQFMTILFAIQRLSVIWHLVSKSSVSVRRKFLKNQSSVLKEESHANAQRVNRYSTEPSLLVKKLAFHS